MAYCAAGDSVGAGGASDSPELPPVVPSPGPGETTPLGLSVAMMLPVVLSQAPKRGLTVMPRRAAVAWSSSATRPWRSSWREARRSSGSAC